MEDMAVLNILSIFAGIGFAACVFWCASLQNCEEETKEEKKIRCW